MKKTTSWILIALVTFTLVFRLYVAFQTPYFDNSAYAEIRQIEHIERFGTPLFDDPGTYGGRYNLFMPLFHYLMAGFDKLLPLKYSLTFFPNLLASSSVLLVYFLAFEITKREDSSLFAAFVSSAVPVYLAETANSVSTLTLSIPLLLLCLYLFMISGKSEAHAIAFLVAYLLLVITSPIAILLSIFLLVYMLLTKVESLRVFRNEVELTLFTTFLALWLYFLIFKKPLLMHGLAMVFQNMPEAVRQYTFAQFSVVEALVLIGIIPLVAGIYITYKHVFIEKQKPYYLMISVIIVTSLLLWLRLLPLNTGLVILGMGFSVLFADYYTKFISYLERSRASTFKPVFVFVLIVIVIVTSVLPAYYVTAVRNNNIVSEDDISALVWLKFNSRQNILVATSLPEGALVSYATGRGVVADMDFIGVKNPVKVVDDLHTLYRTPFMTDAIRIADEYGITHILLTDTARDYYNVSDLAYHDAKCFKTVYNGYEKVKIYRVDCTLKD